MCREEWGGLPPIFPAPAGGMKMEKIKQMLEFYGADTVFLMGGGLFTLSPDLPQNCRTFQSALESAGTDVKGR